MVDRVLQAADIMDRIFAMQDDIRETINDINDVVLEADQKGLNMDFLAELMQFMHTAKAGHDYESLVAALSAIPVEKLIKQ